MQKMYNWGIMGPGKIAHKFASALLSMKNARVYAVGSRTYSRAEEFGKQYNAEKFYGSYNELACDSQVDIIYIATPHSEHYENALLCLNSGKNVLCEKAFTTNERQLKHLVSIARDKNLFLMEGIWTRFLPSIEKLLEIIQSGIIGEIRMIQADFGFMAPFDIEGRIFNPNLAGGSLLDIGIYPLFLSLLLLGEPVEIKALAHIGQTGVDESLAISTLYNNGAMAVLSSTIKVKTTTRADIFGTRGSIGLESKWFSQTFLKLTLFDGKSHEFSFNYLNNNYIYEAEEVMNCIDSGLIESPKLSLDFSLSLMKLMDTIRNQIGLKYPSDIE